MKGQEPVNDPVEDRYGDGPYTVADLHRLADDGKAHELVDGWLIELPPSTRHGYLADVVATILKRAADDSGAHVYVQSPMEISTPAGARRPDVAVMRAGSARDARDLGLSLYPGSDVLLAIEIVSRGSGSEREDRRRKVIEYARTGIDQYWLIDFVPRPRVQILRLNGAAYDDPIMLEESDVLEVSDPFPISFPLSRLSDFS